MQLAFPFHFDARGRSAMADQSRHIRDMIELLLFTSPGERVNRPDFGSGLQQLVFAPNSPELAAALQFTLQASLNRWLGDLIELRGLEVVSDDARLTVSLSYAERADGTLHSADFVRPAA